MGMMLTRQVPWGLEKMFVKDLAHNLAIRRYLINIDDNDCVLPLSRT